MDVSPRVRCTQPDDAKEIPFACTEICVISAKVFISAVRETEMRDDGDSDKRRRLEEALDEALKNTFPASNPVSAEQPTTSGRARRS